MEKNNTTQIQIADEIINCLQDIINYKFTLKSGQYGYYIEFNNKVRITIRESQNTKYNKYYAYLSKDSKISLSIKELNEISIIDSAKYLCNKFNLNINE